MATTVSSPMKRYGRPAFYILCVALLGGVIVQERTTFVQSLKAIQHVSIWWVVAGFVLLLLSVVASAAVYSALSPRPLKFWRTVLVQASGLGINRILPAGVGALGVSYLYLRANKLSRPLSVAIVTANNLFGFMGHALLLGIALVVYPHALGHFHGVSGIKSGPWVVLFLIVILLAGLFFILAGGANSRLVGVIRPLFGRPWQLLAALIFSMLITLCYVATVSLAAAALSYQLSFAASLIILSFGVVAASAIPVPGGVGAAEAGIFAGMHAYGASVSEALAVALLYRLMTFWLPLIAGGTAFIFVDRLGYLSANAKAKRQ